MKRSIVVALLLVLMVGVMSSDPSFAHQGNDDFSNSAEISVLEGDKPFSEFYARYVADELISVTLQDGVSGTFTGNNPFGGSVSYSITGVVADGPATDDISWGKDQGGGDSGYARRSYKGYIVGDMIMLSYNLTGGGVTCESVNFRVGNESKYIGCYDWGEGPRSGSFTLPVPEGGGLVAFKVGLSAYNPLGSIELSVSGEFRMPSPDLVSEAVPQIDPHSSSGGYWQLVQILAESGDSSFNASFHEELCATHNVSWSDGMVTDSVFWPKTTTPDRYSYCENVQSMSYSGSTSWTPPAKILYPGEEITLNGNVTIHERDTVWPAGLSWSVGYDTTHVCTVNPSIGTEFCENQTFTVKSGHLGSEYVINVRVTVTGGTISPGGERMKSSGGYSYYYNWVEGESLAATPIIPLQVNPTSPSRAEVVLPPVTPPPPDPGGLWGVVIGGMAIMGVAAAGLVTVGVGAVAAVLVARAKKRAQERGQDQLDGDEVVGYILDLSTGEVLLMENKPQTVNVTCWRVKASGAYEHAPEAVIAITAPPAASNITVSPLSGQGRMLLQINLAGESNADNHQITVSASAGGQSTAAVVSVFIVPTLEMTLTTHSGETHLEVGDEGLWVCAQIVPDSSGASQKPDLRTPKIRFRLEGPNANWIEFGDPIYRDNWQWVYLLAKPPYPEAQLERGNPTLIAEYQEGKLVLMERMIIELQTEYELCVKLYDSDAPDIVFSQGSQSWQAPGLLVYWINPSKGDIPVKPDFEYGFPEPPLEIDPPCMTLDAFSEYAPHQYLMKFNVAHDLAYFFGEDLVEENGMVQITVEAIDEEQWRHYAVIDYQVRPEAIPFIYYWQESPNQKVDEREYYGVNLKPGEFVADGEDELGVGAFMVRADRAEIFAEAFDHPLALTQPPKAELSGVDSQKYQLSELSTMYDENRYATQVMPANEEPVFYQSQEHELIVSVDLALDQQRYPNYIVKSSPEFRQVKVNPLELYFKLWVLPGLDVGTSDAGGFLFLPAKRKPMIGKELTLDVQASGGATLTANQPVEKTNQHGLATWVLNYQGLTWKNYERAIFTVRCGLPSRKGGYVGTEVRIDIGKNVHELLEDIYRYRTLKETPGNLARMDKRKLDLENDDWKTGSGLRAFIGDLIFPDFLSGPVLNFIYLVSGDPYWHYVCQALRDRLIEFMQDRKFAGRFVDEFSSFSEEKQMSMNGIEYANYSMYMVPGLMDHHFAGIFLSNKNRGPLHDPRFIDPWWRQEWSHEGYKRPKGLYTKFMEHRNMTAAVYTPVALILSLCFKVMVFTKGLSYALSQVKILRNILLTFTGYQGLNVGLGINVSTEITRSDQNIQKARNAILLARDEAISKDFPRVEPIVRW